ncbi:MAG TPA: IS110 family transposase [Dehalococcoidia bacterium]|nr:IS110 family transposase [Dehalococcoidia bacterium]
MEVVYERCCGLDVHKKLVVGCLIIPGPGGKPVKELRTFGTMTEDILSLSEWLAEAGCTVVAMESTGVYWKPVYNMLEGLFDLLLVNAHSIKVVPGRKTDVKDAEWIADLLRHGLLKGSFIPDRERRELRELARYRTSLIQERTAERNRLQKVLEGANIKLASVASDISGVSARAMLEQLVAGSTDVAGMAALARGRLREKIPELEKALSGRFGEHQRFLVTQQLGHLDTLEELIERVSTEIRERMRPFEESIARLDTIPGVGRETAEAIIAEIGVDMSRFPSDRHLSSWAGLAPGNNQSAGKSGSGKTRKGNKWLRVSLVQAAKSLSRSKNSYLSSQYHRLASRRGKNKATIAVAHSILVITYHLLRRQQDYADIGPNYFDQRNQNKIRRVLVHRLESMGYKVTVEPAEQSDAEAA